MDRTTYRCERDERAEVDGPIEIVEEAVELGVLDGDLLLRKWFRHQLLRCDALLSSRLASASSMLSDRALCDAL